MGKIYKETYFHHDHYARQDPKIKEMLVYFRKESEEKAKAAVCVYWWIVEDMHIFDYKIDKIEVYADDYRCSADFLQTILEKFDLFRKDGDCYVSDRVLRNLQEQKEKSEAAKKKAEKRWGNRKGKEEEMDIDFVNQIVQIYNDEFKKTQIVSNENRKKIDAITKDNKLSIEIWQQVFKNAKRGWDIKDKKTSKIENKKPNLKQILENWDLFASGNYNLAPDLEAAKQKEDERKLAEAKQKAEEEEASRIAYEKQMARREAVCDKESAIQYLSDFYPHTEIFIKVSNYYKKFAYQYGITLEDMQAAWNKSNKE